MSTPLRVLIIGDSEDDARLLARELRRGGYEAAYERVETPVAMAAALDRQRWDLVLADNSLPELRVPAVSELLRQRGLDPPFLIVSGTISEEAGVAAMTAGAHGYVTKGNLPRLVPAVERELREAERRRQRAILASRILNDSPYQIYAFDGASLRLIEANRTARRQLGYTADELERLTPPAILAEFDEEQLGRLVEPLHRGERRALNLETVCRRKDGSTYPVEVCLYLADGEAPSVLVAMAMDVAERKRAESSLGDVRTKERSRIAAALHEAVLQPLLSTAQAMQATRMRARDTALSDELAQEIASVRRAARALRNVVYGLSLDTSR